MFKKLTVNNRLGSRWGKASTGTIIESIHYNGYNEGLEAKKWAIRRAGDCMRVYLDNCCYNRPYDDQTQLRISLECQAKLNIQTRIKNGEIELATSYMTFFENNENPYEMRKSSIMDFQKMNSTVHLSKDSDEAVK